VTTAGRYEVAVRTPLIFGTWSFGEDAGAYPEQVTFRFDGREFTWHANSEPSEHTGMKDCPNLTVMLGGSSGAAPEALAANQAMSALSWLYRVPIEPVYGGVVGFRQPSERPLIRDSGVYGGAGRLVSPLKELLVTDDDRLRLVLGLAREARAAGSPFYRFLQFWNAAGAALKKSASLKSELEGVAEERAKALGWPTPAGGWWKHLKDSNRDAIAHAVRNNPSLPALDPDDPVDRGRLARDAQILEALLEAKVDEGWPYAVMAQ